MIKIEDKSELFDDLEDDSDKTTPPKGFAVEIDEELSLEVRLGARFKKVVVPGSAEENRLDWTSYDTGIDGKDVKTEVGEEDGIERMVIDVEVEGSAA